MIKPTLYKLNLRKIYLSKNLDKLFKLNCRIYLTKLIETILKCFTF
jgi:hypothetical protein